MGSVVLVILLLNMVISLLILDFYRYLFKLSPWTVFMRVFEVNVALFVGFFFAGFIVSADVLRVTCGIVASVAVGIVAYKTCARKDATKLEEAIKTYEALIAWEEKFPQLLENFTKSLLTQLDTKLNEVKDLFEETVAVLRQLTSDLAKLKEAASEISRIRDAQYGLTEKLESLATTIEEAALKFEGRRQSKEFYMKKVVKLLQDGGFTVQLGTGRKQPRILAKLGDKKVFVATCKTYTLTPQTRQRTIYLNRLPEAEHAKRLGVDLVLFVANTANQRIWACNLPIENLEKIGTITTPQFLVETTSEAAEKCRQSIKELLQSYTKQ